MAISPSDGPQSPWDFAHLRWGWGTKTKNGARMERHIIFPRGIGRGWGMCHSLHPRDIYLWYFLKYVYIYICYNLINEYQVKFNNDSINPLIWLPEMPWIFWCYDSFINSARSVDILKSGIDYYSEDVIFPCTPNFDVSVLWKMDGSNIQFYKELPEMFWLSPSLPLLLNMLLALVVGMCLHNVIHFIH